MKKAHTRQFFYGRWYSKSTQWNYSWPISKVIEVLSRNLIESHVGKIYKRNVVLRIKKTTRKCLRYFVEVFFCNRGGQEQENNNTNEKIENIVVHNSLLIEHSIGTVRNSKNLQINFVDTFWIQWFCNNFCLKEGKRQLKVKTISFQSDFVFIFSVLCLILYRHSDEHSNRIFCTVNIYKIIVFICVRDFLF